MKNVLGTSSFGCLLMVGALNQCSVEKYVWFQSILPLDQPCCTIDTLRQYIRQYIHRHTFLMKELEGNIAREKSSKLGRRTLSGDATKLQTLQHAVRDAELQFKQGFIVPDLTHVKNVETLREWRGDPNGMDRIKTIVVKDTLPEEMQQ